MTYGITLLAEYTKPLDLKKEDAQHDKERN